MAILISDTMLFGNRKPIRQRWLPILFRPICYGWMENILRKCRSRFLFTILTIAGIGNPAFGASLSFSDFSGDHEILSCEQRLNNAHASSTETCDTKLYKHLQISGSGEKFQIHFVGTDISYDISLVKEHTTDLEFTSGSSFNDRVENTAEWNQWIFKNSSKLAWQHKGIDIFKTSAGETILVILLETFYAPTNDSATERSVQIFKIQ
jgi:hypothetical protein